MINKILREYVDKEPNWFGTRLSPHLERHRNEGRQLSMTQFGQLNDLNWYSLVDRYPNFADRCHKWPHCPP
jgi:hypothetical protein